MEPPKPKTFYLPAEAVTISIVAVIGIVLIGGIFWLASAGGKSNNTSANPSTDPNKLSAFGASALQNLANTQSHQNAQAQQAAQQTEQQIPAGVVFPAGPTEPSASASASPIDCVGPDGKHFQATPQECDTFKKAWGENPASASASPSPSSTPSPSTTP